MIMSNVMQPVTCWTLIKCHAIEGLAVFDTLRFLSLLV